MLNRLQLIKNHLQLPSSTLRLSQTRSIHAMAPTFKLPSGAVIPYPAFGTGTKWYKPGDPTINRAVVDAIVSALKLGYRHIDAAQTYGTEGEVGVAIKESGIPREEIFITTKVYQNVGDPKKALEESLKLLQIDYVDLYLLHHPFITEEKYGITLEKAWETLIELKAAGLTKDIGVSNWAVGDLERVEGAKEYPAVNQIEFNPYLQNQTPGIVEYSQKKGLIVEAFTPLVSLTEKGGPVDEVVDKLATKYGKDAGQIILKWVLARNVLPITTSAKPERQLSNFSLDGFELTPEEVEAINVAGSKKHVRKYWTAEYGHITA
ncbi:NADP-dependent oxidoreductase domain-containing protein [Myxozyma melibiosi]|uniref:NADP-dependent oxidoreductase domain-containing protein n=1 Tax=Myxozyma melibiosi TaxID=54550 RepID=A0ABR1FB94_9ASCO